MFMPVKGNATREFCTYIIAPMAYEGTSLSVVIFIISQIGTNLGKTNFQQNQFPSKKLEIFRNICVFHEHLCENGCFRENI